MFLFCQLVFCLVHLYVLFNFVPVLVFCLFVFYGHLPLRLTFRSLHMVTKCCPVIFCCCYFCHCFAFVSLFFIVWLICMDCLVLSLSCFVWLFVFDGRHKRGWLFIVLTWWHFFPLHFCCCYFCHCFLYQVVFFVWFIYMYCFTCSCLVVLFVCLLWSPAVEADFSESSRGDKVLFSSLLPLQLLSLLCFCQLVFYCLAHLYVLFSSVSVLLFCSFVVCILCLPAVEADFSES